MSGRYAQLTRIAARNALRFHLQSGLILFAAAIGVSGVIAATAFTLGARAKVDAQFVRLGAELIVVTPNPPITGQRRLQGAPAQITQADYVALERQLSSVRSTASTVLSLRVQAGAVSKKTQIIGVEPTFFPIKHWSVREGRLFEAEDNRRLRRVVLLGSSVADALFNDEEAVGQLVMIDRVPFAVIGILATRGQGIDAVDEDDQVYVPLRSSMHRLSDTLGYANLTFDADTIGRIAPLSQRIAAILSARHRSDPATGFRVQDRQGAIDAQLATFARLTALSRGVALAVYAMATIGIFAISWLAVAARTVQIGTMRALGARSDDVLVGFFLEGALPSFCRCIYSGRRVARWGVAAGLIAFSSPSIATSLQNFERPYDAGGRALAGLISPRRKVPSNRCYDLLRTTTTCCARLQRAKALTGSISIAAISSRPRRMSNPIGSWPTTSHRPSRA